MRRPGLAAFRVRHRETDLHVQAERPVPEAVSRWIIEARTGIETYARRRPGFVEALEPWPEDPFAPPVVREMIRAGAAAGVGPMAAVAGAIAEYVGRRLREETGGEVIVENGGDLFVWTHGPATAKVWAGDSPFSGRVGLRLAPAKMPLGLCTSSGRIGHSRSFGRAHAVTVAAPVAALADAAATAAANCVAGPADVDAALALLQRIPGVSGGLVIVGRRLGAWGDIELAPI
ncbi:UPF0280 family protein [Dissulfurirhabdus thermomarina]|uniref:UPF0280 family protein n=2 Tax=Dissulfurirhabdus thermomarina TaxID=1765737 RepID=A0A6N9TN63_DISTH|nr:UPF0280 family protein [Dissulfurirhabdus thermomarina]NMX22456.1 UPF0280 family protein [Dissulfurirhabdus thermomarina]